ncbi:MAG TPA: 1-(5-phosphoribosyl)-5-[(5-phosphoribosylamino)methylideneamino] imidazole-4-carboxamide isomerase [Candidatus Saccharimonadales bacterium]|nr:1-(5-phosphoribosyl)-5-[(5-phosphoribosylamino)methylideneamino] imidazole-4-carboxamide isomerase [Candidatus Saccharimonadales bacterium]
MQVIPAIDLRGGSCVQLVGGDVSKETLRIDDPLAQAARFIEQGARRLHIVDLDRALEAGSNIALIKDILAANPGVSFQVGGGLRQMSDIDELLNAGAEKVVTSTRALLQPGWLKEAASNFGKNVIVAIDAKDDEVVSHGWQQSTGLNLYEAAIMAEEDGAGGIIYTDVNREGRLQGPNVVKCFDLAGIVEIEMIASGGIRSNEDIYDLAEAEVDGVILGTAAYTGQLSLGELFR